MADELDDEERALLDEHRAAKAAKAEDEREVWIRQGDREASVPYSKARKWLGETFGIDLDEEPVQGDEPEKAAAKAKPKTKATPDEGRVILGRKFG
jgi:hypothetical protein